MLNNVKCSFAVKQFLFIMIFCFGYLLQSIAQKQNKKPDIETVIVAIVTKRLDLTEAEANAFFPVFNNYRKEYRTQVMQAKDDEIKKAEAILVVQKKYKPQFVKILSSEARANKTFKVHNDLMQRLKNLQERRKNKIAEKPNVI